MVKCPNCNSTAQVKQVGTYHVTYSHLIEVWKCLCGCTIRRTMKVTNQMIEYPNGTTEIKDE